MKQEVGQKADDLRALDRLRMNLNVQTSLPGDAADDREALAALHPGDHGGRSCRAPCLAHRWGQGKSTLIHEDDRPSLIFSPPADVGPRLAQPELDLVLIALSRLRDRLLIRPLDRMKQPTDMVGVVRDTELALDEVSDSLAGPRVVLVSGSGGSLIQKTTECCKLRFAKASTLPLTP